MSEIDEKLGSLDLKARNYIRGMLQNKDDAIKKLEVENMQLKNQIKHMDIDGQKVKSKFEILDKAVEETLASLDGDSMFENVEEGLYSMKIRLENCDKLTCELTQKKTYLEEVEVQMRETVSSLTNENVTLKEELETVQELYTVTKQTMGNKIDTLDTSLKEETKRLFTMQGKSKATESMYRQTIASLQSDLRILTEQIKKLRKELKDALFDRDRVKSEMTRVEDRTRKLLISLGLGNDCDSLPLMLDHARNISYVRRRRGSTMGQSLQEPMQPNNTPHVRRETVGVFPGLVSTNSNRYDRSSFSSLPPSSNGEPPKRMRTSTDNSPTVVFGGSSMRNTSAILESPSPMDRSTMSTPASDPKLKCSVCSKSFEEKGNFEGACIHHVQGANKINPGTQLEVWSCCMSRDTYRGCIKSRHISLEQ